MKKILSLALALCVMLTVCSTGLMSITASAAQKIDGSEVTWSFDDMTKTLTFDGKGDIPDFDEYRDEDGNSKLPWGGIDFENVVFGEGVTGIGNYALYRSLFLESITLPENIVKIGKGAFLNCKVLTSVTINGKIMQIADHTFSSCSLLENVVLPDTITSVGVNSFYKCSLLKTINLPDSVKTIGESAFGQSIQLASFKAPASLESIGDRAFYCCENLKSVDLGDKIVSIGISAFDGCEKLESVSFPSSLKKISEAAFSGCTKLGEVNFSDGLETIDADAFYLCKSLSSVTIPRTVTSIGKQAIGYGRGGNVIDGFTITGYEDTTAQSYADENGITFNSLGKYVPMSGTISDTLTWKIDENGTLIFEGSGKIGDYSLDNLPEYLLAEPTAIELSDGITSIGAYAFFGFEGPVFIPETVTNIGNHAFGYYYNEDGAEVVNYDFIIMGYKDTTAEQYAAENEIQFFEIMFEGECGETAKWSYDVETLTLTISGTGAMADSSLEKIPYYLIYPIEKIVVEDGITKIGNYSFIAFDNADTENKVTVTLPKSVSEIGEHSIGYILVEGEERYTEELNKNCTIEGFTDSAAEKYAADNELTFIKLDPVDPPAPTDPDLTFKLNENAEICTFDEGNKIITVYDKSATLDKILADFTVGKNLSVAPIEKIATGAELITKNGDETVETYTIVVIGDVNGDGEVNSMDALVILQHSVEEIQLTGATLLAANIDSNDKVDSSDALAVLQISVEEKTPADYFPKETPDVPESPDVPETPDVPEKPDVPETPDVPKTPDVPETPDIPETPDTPSGNE